MSSSSTFAIVPSSVTVPAGATSANFTVSTNNGTVLSNTPVTITATLGNSTLQANMTITPASGATLSSLTLNPTSVSGGSSSTGTVILSRAAPSQGALVKLTSSNTSVASVPSSVTVQGGQTSAKFTVRTQSVSSNTSVRISGTFGGVTKSATLTVAPKQ